MGGRLRFVVGLAGALLLLASTRAAAVPVAFDLAGTLTSVTDPRGLLPAALTPGAAFTASLRFDADPTCLVVAPTVCEYLAPAGVFTLSVGGESIALVTGSALLFVQDGDLLDGISASLTGPLPAGAALPPAWYWTGVSLQDPSATALDALALPILLPSLDGFAVRGLDAGGCYAACSSDALDAFRIEGSVSSGSVMPEPRTAGLVVLGFAALALRSRSGGQRG